MFWLNILQSLFMDNGKKTKGDEEFILFNNIGVSFPMKKMDLYQFEEWSHVIVYWM